MSTAETKHPVYQEQIQDDEEDFQQDTPSGHIRRYKKIGGRYAMSKMMRMVMKHITDDMSVIKNLRMREDDILLLTYPKSGTHWTSEIMKMLIAGKADYHLEYKANEWIEAQDVEKLERLPSPRVLNSHLAVQDLPDQVMEKRCRVVLVHRNPKDVCVSYYNFRKSLGDFGGTWDDFFYLFAEHKDPVFCSWFDFTKDAFEYAKKYDFVHSLHFEDLKMNSHEEIKRLAMFLNVQPTEELVNEITGKCSFTNLKKASELKTPMKLEGVPSNLEVFRKGEVADWKNWFTVAQNEKFDKLYREHMKDCDVEIKFTA